MKNQFLLSLLSLGLLCACHTAQKAQTPASFASWDKKMIPLGAVKKGEKRSMFFEFTNTSGAPVQIDIVDACDCTKVEFPRGVIEPGAKGRLDVVFDSKEKDASETIGINVVFKQTDASGNPRIEVVEYSFDLIKMP